ncbi:MAG: hypothetical protein MAG794_01324 [Gammaproteobacteria bacterium]|nr:hypothetical protein [Gammaproteobacteria bacterium]
MEPGRPADQHQRGSDPDKRGKDKRAITEARHQTAADQHGGEVADKVAGADEPHLRIAQPQVLAHGGQQHAEREPADTEAGEDGQHAGKDDNPAVVEREAHGTVGHGIVGLG